MLSVSEPDHWPKGPQAVPRGRQVVGCELLAGALAGARKPASPTGHAGKITRIEQLIASRAWVECAFALVELELPQWKLRRLVYEEGLWLCTLSRHWSVPDWLGDSVEVRNELLPVAILEALIEARDREGARPTRTSGSVPSCGIETGIAAMCCDNF